MSRVANAARGEATIKLENAAIMLRPTFAALVAAEEELGPLFALVERAAAGQLKLRQAPRLSPATYWSICRPCSTARPPKPSAPMCRWAGTPPDAVAGYALQGGSARAALAPLVELCSAQVRPRGEKLELYRPETAGVFVGNLQPVTVAGGQAPKLPSESRAAARRQPIAVALRYYDPQRDYQAGLQRGGWSTSGNIDEQLDLPAVLDTGAALQIAQNIALQRESRRDRCQLAIATGADPLAIGQAIGAPGLRAAEIEHFSGYMVVNSERWPALAAGPPAALEPGRHQPAPDLSAGQTLLQILELPSIGSSAATEPVIALAAGGSEAGWRRAAVSRILDDQLSDVGTIGAPSPIGVTLAPVSAHSPNLIDTHNILQIRLDSNAAPPESAATSPLAPNAPALMLGDELIRYGAIEPLGGNYYAVRDLLRDGAKTGPQSHPTGERIIFMDRNRLLVPELGAAAIGSLLEFEAIGLGDADPVYAGKAVTGAALKPPAPVHGKADRQLDGAIILSWIWRARHDPGWLDGVDLPLVESSSRFQLLVAHDAMPILAAQVEGEALVIDAAQVASWPVSMGQTIDIAIRQIGNFGISNPLMMQLLL